MVKRSQESREKPSERESAPTEPPASTAHQRRRTASPAGSPTPGPSGQSRSGSGPRPAAGLGGSNRESVAAGRLEKKGSNRTQLTIGAVVIALMIIAVVVGLVLNRKANAIPDNGYGASKLSTATLADGVITVGHGSPTVVLDAYDDALSADSAALQHQYQQQIAKAVDTGKLTVRYHLLNFLQLESPSKTYSTRASAAMMCVADLSGSRPGVFMNYYAAIFDSGNQPTANGTSDLSNAKLAALAVEKGASDGVTGCINAGTYLDQAAATAKASAATLAAMTSSGAYSTPTILRNGSPININTTGWLTNLVGT